jgi:hypothetical protein
LIEGSCQYLITTGLVPSRYLSVNWFWFLQRAEPLDPCQRMMEGKFEYAVYRERCAGHRRTSLVAVWINRSRLMDHRRKFCIYRNFRISVPSVRTGTPRTLRRHGLIWPSGIFNSHHWVHSTTPTARSCALFVVIRRKQTVNILYTRLINSALDRSRSGSSLYLLKGNLNGLVTSYGLNTVYG